MTEQEAIQLATETFGEGKFPKPLEIFFRDNFDGSRYDEGRHGLGTGKWISETDYVNCNERCDSHLKILNHPQAEAIQSNHYHSRGWVGSLTIFLKK